VNDMCGHDLCRRSRARAVRRADIIGPVLQTKVLARLDQMVPTDLTFRMAVAADVGCLTDCFVGAMRETITATRGQWNEASERAQFREQLDLRETRIIRAGTLDVGFVMLARQYDALQIHTLCIAPEYQGKGIGSQVTTDVIQQGVQTGSRVILSVLKTNNRAEALYRRLGFRVIEESEHHRHMQYHGGACQGAG